MADLCEFSGVNRVGCAHCTDDTTAPRAGSTHELRSAPFPARFPGTCAGTCGFDIKVGERVRYVGDRLSHTGCADG